MVNFFAAKEQMIKEFEEKLIGALADVVIIPVHTIELMFTSEYNDEGGYNLYVTTIMFNDTSTLEDLIDENFVINSKLREFVKALSMVPDVDNKITNYTFDKGLAASTIYSALGSLMSGEQNVWSL